MANGTTRARVIETKINIRRVRVCKLRVGFSNKENAVHTVRSVVMAGQTMPDRKFIRLVFTDFHRYNLLFFFFQIVQ